MKECGEKFLEKFKNFTSNDDMKNSLKAYLNTINDCYNQIKIENIIFIFIKSI